MGAFSVIAVALGVVVVLFSVLMGLFVRRRLLRRGGGGVEMSLRITPHARHGRGWALGVGRFAGDELQWYRIFSFSLWPKRTFSRQCLQVVEHRQPHGPENLALLAGSIVLGCQTDRGPVELAMTRPALTGFQSWLESSAPGSGLGVISPP